jgi:hypothetical protein
MIFNIAGRRNAVAHAHLDTHSVVVVQYHLYWKEAAETAEAVRHAYLYYQQSSPPMGIGRR